MEGTDYFKLEELGCRGLADKRQVRDDEASRKENRRTWQMKVRDDEALSLLSRAADPYTTCHTGVLRFSTSSTDESSATYLGHLMRPSIVHGGLIPR